MLAIGMLAAACADGEGEVPPAFGTPGDLVCFGTHRLLRSQIDLYHEGSFVDVSVGDGACALDVEGDIHCFHEGWGGEAWVVWRGPFHQVSVGDDVICAIDSRGQPVCQPNPPDYQPNLLFQEPMTFRSLRANARQDDQSISTVCGLRADGSLLCLDERGAITNSLEGELRSLSFRSRPCVIDETDHLLDGEGNVLDSDFVHADCGSGAEWCGTRRDGTTGCRTRDGGWLSLDGTFSQITVGCGLRPSGAIDCWDLAEREVFTIGSGFSRMDANGSRVCAIRP